MNFSTRGNSEVQFLLHISNNSTRGVKLNFSARSGIRNRGGNQKFNFYLTIDEKFQVEEVELLGSRQSKKSV